MGTSAVQYKLMPENVEADLASIQTQAKQIIEEKGGVFSNAQEEPIAFGLKALICSFAYPEEQEIDEVGNELVKIPGVSSAEMTDYRRAIG